MQGSSHTAAFLGMPPHVKSLRSSYMGLYPQSIGLRCAAGGVGGRPLDLEGYPAHKKTPTP